METPVGTDAFFRLNAGERAALGVPVHCPRESWKAWKHFGNLQFNTSPGRMPNCTAGVLASPEHSMHVTCTTIGSKSTKDALFPILKLPKALF